MATISELMAGKKPGEIRIHGKEWPQNAYFTPYFLCDSLWYGMQYAAYLQSPRFAEYPDDATFTDVEWQLYQPPNQKVKRWLWAYFYDGRWRLRDELYRSLEEVARDLKIFDKVEVKKLPWSETEFDE